MWPLEKVSCFRFPYYIQHSNVKLKCEHSVCIQQSASSQEKILDRSFLIFFFFLCFSHHISVGFGRRFPFSTRETRFVLVYLIREFGMPRVSLCEQTETDTSRIIGAVVTGTQYISLTSLFEHTHKTLKRAHKAVTRYRVGRGVSVGSF